MRRTALLLLLSLGMTMQALADCPEGSWPRNQYTGPGGGLYTGPGGGIYTGPGGGRYTGPGGGMYTGPGGGMYSGPGGGLDADSLAGVLYTGPGGGLYTGPGGGMYTGPGDPYCKTMPPWPELAAFFDRNGMSDAAAKIRAALAR